MIGNTVFYRGQGLLSRIVAKLTKSKFSHVSIILKYDELTKIATVIESNILIRTRVTTIKIDENHVIYDVNVNDEIREKIIENALDCLKTKYDYFQDFGIFLSIILKIPRFQFFDDGNKYICSELIDMSYFRAGVPRKNLDNLGDVTPQELLYVYDLKELKL